MTNANAHGPNHKQRERENGVAKRVHPQTQRHHDFYSICRTLFFMVLLWVSNLAAPTSEELKVQMVADACDQALMR